ncbi:MAG TPA: hypothetical protein VJI46_07220 [Candidatus Nanoarchaeia archaeon]|nr:hypothetical protein [Candidatus Nanoarchaeia archaeon]
MKRLLVVFFLLVPIAYADVDFAGPLNEHYNLGDKIQVEALLQNPEPGLLKASIDCSSRSVLYFVTPIDENSPSQISIPEYTASQPLIGDCHLALAIDSLDGNGKSERSSSEFKITNEIIVDAVSDKLEYKPSETIKISGTARKKSGLDLRNATIYISLDDETKSLEGEGSFEYNLPIKSTSKSGKKELSITARDSDANEGSIIIPINLLPKASSMEIILNGKEFMPKNQVEFRIAVYDQAREVMEIPVKTEIRDSSGSTVQSLEIMSGIISAFTLDSFAMPGTYTIKASVGGLSGEGRFYVKRVEMLESKYEGQIVTITNIGNVLYENETTIILEGDGKKIILSRELSLEPGASETIDLSREVPGGVYTITMPENTAGNEEVIRDVAVEDNRPITRKVSQALIGVTGHSTAFKSSGLKIAPYILIAVLIGLIAYFSPKNMIKMPKMPKLNFTDRQKYINRILKVRK